MEKVIRRTGLWLALAIAVPLVTGCPVGGPKVESPLNGQYRYTCCNIRYEKPEITDVNYTQGTPAFNTDRNNFAPSLGVTWRPTAESGLLRGILGQDGDTVLFGSYALAYERAGMADFSDVFSDNPGVSIAVNRNATIGNLNNDGQGFPVLLRQSSRLGAPSFQTSCARRRRRRPSC